MDLWKFEKILKLSSEIAELKKLKKLRDPLKLHSVEKELHLLLVTTGCIEDPNYIKIEYGSARYCLLNKPEILAKINKSLGKMKHPSPKITVPKAPLDLDRIKMIAFFEAEILKTEKILKNSPFEMRSYWQQQLSADKENLEMAKAL